MKNIKNFAHRLTHKRYNPFHSVLFLIFLIVVNACIDPWVAFLFILLWFVKEFYAAWKERGYPD